MVVISFLKVSFVRTHIYLFIITIIITTVIGAGALKLHLIHYIFILAFALKGTRGLINAVAFGELDMLFILEIFSVTFIDQICNLGIQI